MNKCILIFQIFSLICSQYVVAQTIDSTTVEKLFLQQINAFPQEKLHVHTDKTSYVVGDTVRMRIHLVDAIMHQQANASRYVYVELINPLNENVKRVMLRPDTLGFFHGYLALEELLSEGNYTLRAYTRYMQNVGEEYFFRKSIRIIDPLSEMLSPIVRFSPDGKHLNAEISFYDIKNNQKLIPTECEIQFDSLSNRKLSFDPDTIAHYKFRNPEKQRIFLLKAVYNGKKYSRFFSLPDAEDAFTVSFFPEGGQAPLSAPVQIAFKSLNKNGLGENIHGTIYDNTGEEHITFNSQHLGMGSFSFAYEPGLNYYAVCTNERGISRRFELPAALSGAVSLRTFWQDNYLSVSLAKAPETIIADSLQLVIHLRGVVLYSQPWDLSRERIVFEKDYFPAGVFHLLLLDKDRNILSERLAFSQQETSIAKTEFNVDKEQYGRREKINCEITVTDHQGNPLTGNFSMAVVDERDITNNGSSSILSTLLLTSELKGHIESPMSYFELPRRQSVMALDILMMTQGWRRYNVPDILKGKIATKLPYPLEFERTISGKATKLFSSVKNGEVMFIAMRSSSVMGTDVTMMDNKGRFTFNQIEYPDSTWFIIQSKTAKGGKNNFLELDATESFPLMKLPPLPQSVVETAPEDLIAYIEKANKKYAVEHGMRVINLAEVEIIGQRRKQATVSSPYYSIQVSKVLTEEDVKQRHISSIFQLLRELPGVTVSGNSVQYRMAEPLAIIDDIPMEDFDFSSLNVDDVGSIFVAPAVSVMPVFGGRAANGAIIVTTKRGFVQKNELSSNMQVLKPIGYQQTVDFYSPVYETKEAKERYDPDLRSTIYWKPDVTTNEHGKATVDFYSADPYTRYRIIMEGMSKEGYFIYGNDWWITVGE